MPVTNVYNNIYLIEVPLPKNPLKYLNAYLIRGKDRNLLIDTGFNHQESENALRAGLQELSISMERTDIFLTPMHSDHTGLVASIKSPTTTVWASALDGEIIKASGSEELWSGMEQLWSKFGFVEDSHSHPGRKYSSDGSFPIKILEEGNTLTVGDYRFQVLHTPGHTAGHLCLYEAKHKILFVGDTILADITPNITPGQLILNPLRLYFKSLERLEKLPVAHTFTAHRSPSIALCERIVELKLHHQERLREVQNIIRSYQKLTASETASHMSWDISARTWDEFPVSQKWFAVGEAAAHLQYLVEERKISRRDQGDLWIYEK